MKGGKNRHSDGYTILEVMIVLAISALLFLMAASFINGKQSSTSFTTGVAQFSSNLQGVLDQVTNGQYSDVPLQCTYSGSGLNITTKPSDTGDVSPDQGTNPQCVFLGKMVHFTGDLPTTGYTVYSIAGARLLPSGQPAIGLGGAMPTAVSFLNKSFQTPQNLYVIQATEADSGDVDNPPHNFTFGFYQSQGSLTTGSGPTHNDYQSGGQNINLYTDAADTHGNNNSYDISTLMPTDLGQVQTIYVCLSDQSNDYAYVQIGSDPNSGQSNASQLEVTSHIYRDWTQSQPPLYCRGVSSP